MPDFPPAVLDHGQLLGLLDDDHLQYRLISKLNPVYSEIRGDAWTKYSGNPVLSRGSAGEWDSRDIEDSIVVKVGDKYYLFYSGRSGTTDHSDNYQIGYAEATNLYGPWTKYSGNPILTFGDSGEFDYSYLRVQSLIKIGDTWYMYYWGADSGGTARIGVATCPEADFPSGPWTKSASNPILDLGASGEFDSVHVLKPYVIKIGEIYYMFYAGNDGSKVRIGVACSHDGISWLKYGSFINDVGPSGSWDENETSSPMVLRYGDVFYFFYEGIGSAPLDYWQIGQGIMINPLTLKPSFIGLQVRPEAITVTTYSDFGGRVSGLSGGYYRLMAALQAPSGETIYCRLYNVTDGKPVANSEVSTTSTTEVVLYSGGFKLHRDKVYVAQVMVTGGTGYVRGVRLVDYKIGMDMPMKSPHNPVLSPTSGEWDSGGVANPFVFREGNTWYLFYTGFDGSYWTGIGIATQPVVRG